MKRLCHIGKLKERSLAYSISIMLISRKATKDKRLVTDFRHLNVRKAKKQLGLPFFERYIFGTRSFQM